MKDPTRTDQELLAENAVLKQKMQAMMRSESESGRLESALQDDKRLSESIINSLPGIFYLCDARGKFLRWNRNFELISGYSPQEMRQRHPADFFASDDKELLQQHIREAFVNGMSNLEACIISRNGLSIPFFLTGVKIEIKGQPHLMGMGVDITERKRAEERLRESEERYRTILENIEDGYFEVDIAGNFTFFNDSACRMLGYSRAEMMGMNSRQYTDKENGKILYQAFNTVFRTGEPSQGVDYEIIRKDGAKLHIASSISLIRNTSGQPIAFRSIMRNITERKQAEEARKESEAKYYDFYNHAPDMYYSLDLATGTIQECNETFIRKTGYSKEELIGRPIGELYDAGGADDAKTSFQQLELTGEVHDAECRVKCNDGHTIDVSLNVSPIRDKEGNITHSRSIWRDITRRKEHEELIRALSITDQLTGLYNRRGFTTLAEQQLRMAARTKNGIVLLFADVDGLKRINDQLGHKSGDNVIVEAANVLKEVFRKMDIIARMGGDEFAVLALEASLEYADMIKHRLQDQLNIHNAWTGREYALSLSIGMLYHDPSTPSSLDELLSRADTLMYEQKRLKVP